MFMTDRFAAFGSSYREVSTPRWISSSKRYRMASRIQRRPPEHPAQHADALLLDLFCSEQFVRMFVAVVAAQAQAVAG